ncbi:HypC/HybG/HupF family hydrogenase formation chaperone [Patescibacteria group bacterium]
MCLAIPGKITSIDRSSHAVVSFSGLKKKVNIELIGQAKKGDWVTVHAGFAIGKLSAKDAERTLELFNE